MCLNCGCGEPSNIHGDPLNITLGKLRLIALRNNSTMEKMAENIIATLRNIINKENPRENDQIVVGVFRRKVKPKQEVQFVPKSKLVRPKNKARRSVEES